MLVTLDAGLRAVPTDREALEGAVGEVRAALRTAEAAGDDRAVLARTRELGFGLLVLGDHAAAARLLARAAALADAAGDVRSAVAARVNLGDAHRYAGDHAGAEPVYRRALADARRDAPDRVDFALQHLGKHCTELGRRAEARSLLREALALREAKGDAALIKSTRAALQAAEDLAV
jgi:tetratricopeptide (TPR) repeat protein